MAERSLRGSSIGSKSLETESGVEFAPRVEATYDLPDGRVVVVPFSAEAEIPPVWETPVGEGLLRDAQRPEDAPGKKQRTHWDMLLERRTRAELQELLDERLDLLRSGQLRRRSA
ncbi:MULTISPECIES: RNA polymerase-binding protein RbpA [unclassified Pseudactinotalea]|uniref:RNA polymerase-binding protein RbpA n=1 Tax=unclassified Pseudactinotalea TaxID=2649176 RepID=UPI00128B0758|nr:MULTISPECIES: RNA polymerase-binding protein RbpA [unclassified Pseudactinotalea]MPV49303.1 RNA polymerase-binding protein RbpA [Pseudactinotalea sp. HY160]QGH69402.1 RNA polymerase-binding protein RbpA [Pseudactinotalea sp. HY158]